MSVLERVLEQQQGLQDGRTSGRDPQAPNKDHLGQQRSRLKSALIERLGLDVIAATVGAGDIGRAREELIVACNAILNQERFAALSTHERELLVSQVVDEVVGLGPLQPLLDDSSVSEVMVNGCDALFFEREGRIESAGPVFESPEQILMIIDRILAPLGRRLDQASPIVNARLANGDRVNAVASPIALDGPVVTIRKFSNRITTLHELVALGSLPDWYAHLLSWAVQVRQDVAVAGGTGSGKTTLLNALSCEIGQEERIITIEDSAELRFDSHPDVVRLEARDASLEGTGAISIRDLVRNALRMRPDRIVVGECRGEEAIDVLQAMSTGHDGSLTTLHAGTAQEAVLRLVLMARFGMDLPASLLEEQIATALDLLVMSQRLPNGSRRITSMSTVGRASQGGVELCECVSYDRIGDSWTLVFEPSFVAEAIDQGRLDEKEVLAWRRTCPYASSAA